MILAQVSCTWRRQGYEPCLDPLCHRVPGNCQLMVEDLVASGSVVGTGGPIRTSVRCLKLLVTGGNVVNWVQHRETNKLVIWLDGDVMPPLGSNQLIRSLQHN